MKLILIVISIIIALQATSLLFNAHQRHVFHNSLSQYEKLFCSQNHDYSSCCRESTRWMLVAFLYASSYLLLIGETVWPAWASQVLWISLESHLCTDKSLNNIKHFLVQIVILWILTKNLSNQSKTAKAAISKALTSQKQISSPQK